MCLSQSIISKIICILTFAVIEATNGWVNNFENVTRIRRQDQDGDGNGCILPDHPNFGRWSVYEDSSFFLPGNSVKSGTILLIRCKENYKLDGDTALVCINNRWTAPLGSCLRTCPSVKSTTIMKVSCTYDNKRSENCIDAVHGTSARFECVDFYEDPSLRNNLVHVCTNGKWSYSIPECVPVCGQNVLSKPTLIVNGESTNVREFPWQAAIYGNSDKVLLCGGSLLNPRVVLTAAHCVTNNRGRLLPKEDYVVAIGKTYRRHDDPNDSDDVQFSKIREMFIPRQYKGDVQNFLGDIAILIVQKTFVLSATVQPVCVDWEFRHQSEQIDQEGYVAGWGYTVQHEKPSDVLKKLKVPLISSDKCVRDLPEDYDRFMTDDKLCAGYLNSSTAVCRGDSGGGLVIKYGKRFFLTGIVSVSPQANTEEGGCDSQQYGLYTNVSYYISNFILEKEAQFKPCDGRANCQDDSTNTEGEFCKLSNFVGTCKQSCGSARGENVESCGYNMVCCPLDTNLAPGVRSAAQCFNYYGNPGIKIKKFARGPNGIITAQQSQFPHMVALGFGDADDGVQWSCGGTLISDKFVLTAGQCAFNKEVGSPNWARLGRLDVTNNTEEESDIRIKKITVNPSYKYSTVYDDIALVELAQKVVFTESIAPACLHTKDRPIGQLQIIGWGAIEFGGLSSPTLMIKGHVNVVNYEECVKRYQDNRRRMPKGVVNETQLCAGHPNGYDTCQGDAGGPLQFWEDGLQDMQGHFVRAGITSFGRVACFLRDSAGIYTRVSAYVEWIENIVWQ